MRSSEDAWSFAMTFGRRSSSLWSEPERRYRAQSYSPVTYWVWGGWDYHAQHPDSPFVVPERGVFLTN